MIVEKVLFGTEDEQNEIRKEARDELFGIKVNSENINFVISELEKQLQKQKRDDYRKPSLFCFNIQIIFYLKLYLKSNTYYYRRQVKNTIFSQILIKSIKYYGNAT